MRLLLVGCLALLLGVSYAQNYGCGVATDFIFLLDSSGSLVDNANRGDNWRYVVTFLENVVLNLGESVERQYPTASSGLRYTLIQFARTAMIMFDYQRYHNYTEVAYAIGLARPIGGSSNMTAAFQATERLLSAYDRYPGSVRNTIVIVISDWRVDPSQRTAVVQAAQRLEYKYSALTVATVGVFGYADEQLLQAVASNQNTAFLSEDFRALSNYVYTLVTKICELPSQPAMIDPCYRDIVLCLDASYSITDLGFRRLKDFAATLVPNLALAGGPTRIGLVVFSSEALVVLPLTPYTSGIQSTIQNISLPRQLTNHADALRKAALLFTDPNRLRIVLVITDGLPTEEIGKEIQESKKMRAAGITIVPIGVTSAIDHGTLENMAGAGNPVFWSPDYNTGIFSQLVAITGSAACPARQPLPPELPPICVDRPALIVVAIDSSGSIKDKGPNNWELMQNFAVNLIRGLSLQRPTAQFAAIVFSDNARTLSGFTGAVQLVASAIYEAKFDNGFTNPAAAFRATGTLIQNIDTSKYYVIMIMVTDGEATLEAPLKVNEANRLKANNVSMIMVGVTKQILRENLEQLASSPLFVFESPDFQSLNDQIEGVIQATRYCVPGQITTTVAPTTPAPVCYAADVVFALDNSGSILEKGKNNFELLKNFTINLARTLVSRYPLVRFGLVLFSDDAKIIAELKDYQGIETFVSKVRGLNYTGSQTNMADAIRVSREMIVRGGIAGPQIIILTDGIPTVNSPRELTEASDTRQLNIRLAAIGITSDVDRDLLTRLTGDPSRVFYSPDFTQLQQEVVNVAATACGQSGIGIGPSVAPPSCEGETQIVFALDASGSITEISGENWFTALELIRTAIDYFSGTNPTARFGLVVFSTRARVEFPLVTGADAINRIVRGIRYDQDRTNIAEAIEVALDQILRPGKASSSNKELTQILIIITDGKPNERTGEEDYQALRTKQTGVFVLPVGITNEPDFALMQRISSSSTVVTAPNFQTLTREIERLTQAVCRSNPNSNSGNTGNNAAFPIIDTDKCSSGYVAIVIDVSYRLQTIGRPYNGLEGVKTLAINLVRSILSKYYKTKFALVIYDSDARIIRTFYDYRSQADFESYISMLQYSSSTISSIAAAMRATQAVVAQIAVTRSQAHLFSDGVTNLDVGLEEIIANNIRAAGCQIVSIALTPSPQFSLLYRLTADQSLVYHAQHYEFTSTQLQDISTKFLTDCKDINDQNSINPSACSGDVVFVVDASVTLYTENDDNWRRMMNLLTSIVEAYADTKGVSVRFATVLFSDNAQVAFYLNEDPNMVRFLIQRMKYTNSDQSNWYRGLNVARTRVFESNNFKKILIFLTPGNPTVQVIDAFSEADAVRNNSITTVVIGIGSNTRRDFGERIAGSPNNFIRTPDFARLLSEVQNIINTGCNSVVYPDAVTEPTTTPSSTLPSSTPPSPKPSTAPSRATVRDAAVTPPPATNAPPATNPPPATNLPTTPPWLPTVPPTRPITTIPPRQGRSGFGGSNCPLHDIAFIVDSSSEINSRPSSSVANWEQVQNTFIRLVDYIDTIGPSNTRIAAAQFSDVTTIAFYLNDKPSKNPVKYALADMKIMASARRDVSGALKYTRTEIFQNSNGDRAEATNVAVLFVTGMPDLRIVETQNEARNLKQQARLVVVAITRDLTAEQVQEVGSWASDNLFLKIEDYNKLPDAVNTIGAFMCAPAVVP